MSWFLLGAPALGVAALALAVFGLTFPGVVAGAAAAWLGGQAWPANREAAAVALGCGGLALAIGFVALVQTAYPG